MRELGLRILRRAVPVALALALMGYLFAEITLMLYQMNGGVADPANDAIRWKAPLRMALIGIALLVILECVSFVIRRKPPVKSGVEATIKENGPETGITE